MLLVQLYCSSYSVFIYGKDAGLIGINFSINPACVFNTKKDILTDLIHVYFFNIYCIYNQKRIGCSYHPNNSFKHISSGLDKNLNSNLPCGQASLKVCLPEPISHLPAFKKFKAINDSRDSHEKCNLMIHFFPSFQCFLKQHQGKSFVKVHKRSTKR